MDSDQISIAIGPQKETQRQECCETQSQRHRKTGPSKIQRVPHYLRDREDFAKYYTPRLVSMGPIHHGDNNLQQGERYKKMWTEMYIKETKQCAQALRDRILNHLKELKDSYTEDAIRFDNKKLAEMLFVDGCSLLQVLNKVHGDNPDELLEIKGDQLMLVHRDVHLLENQLPYLVLKLLSKSETGLIESMDRSFFECYHFSPRSGQKDQKEEMKELPPPTHLLDHRRTTVLLDEQDRAPKKGPKKWRTYRNINIEELKAAGIRVKRTYEMCPDFQNDYEITSFVKFLDSLIDHPNDVKALRAATVLDNYLGSDEEVAKLFNTMTTDVIQPGYGRYSRVRADIEEHYKNIYKTWIAQARHTYFSTPWAIIAFLAAVLALILTAIQTWFTVLP